MAFKLEFKCQIILARKSLLCHMSFKVHIMFLKKKSQKFFFLLIESSCVAQTLFFQVCTCTPACAFSLGDFSNFTKYLPTIILGKFNYAVKCKKHCNTCLVHLLRVLKCIPA